MNIGFKVGLICFVILTASIFYIRTLSSSCENSRSSVVKGVFVVFFGIGSVFGIVIA